MSRSILLVAVLMALHFIPQTTVAFGCNKSVLVKIGEKTVYKEKTAVIFRADLEVDADGSPKAYHPDNDKLALDYKANGYPWGIVFVNNKPRIQSSTDPAPGYYVSKTSLQDKSKKVSNPNRYVDSAKIPYIVLPPAVISEGNVKLGDFAVVINKKNNKVCYAIFADIGPKKKLGEGSIALANALGIKKSPKHGGESADLVYVVFAGSGNKTPSPVAEIEVKGAEYFSAWGGIELVTACFP